MRCLWAFFLTGIFISGCGDKTRVYEQYADFENRYWLVGDTTEFEFEILQPADKYTLYGNIRNTVSYPNARLFFTYYLQDSTGNELEKKLVTRYLFDAKTGKPFGSSGLGDIYDHRVELVRNYQFKYKGKYKIKLAQSTREDTLKGILAIGLRIENSSIPR
jgi:gliding motility-associated lipoprotein GldH